MKCTARFIFLLWNNESQDADRSSESLTWEAFAGQMSQRPEDVTHEWGAAGAGLGDGREDFLDINLKVFLQPLKIEAMNIRCGHCFNVQTAAQRILNNKQSFRNLIRA